MNTLIYIYIYIYTHTINYGIGVHIPLLLTHTSNYRISTTQIWFWTHINYLCVLVGFLIFCQGSHFVLFFLLWGKCYKKRISCLFTSKFVKRTQSFPIIRRQHFFIKLLILTFLGSYICVFHLYMKLQFCENIYFQYSIFNFSRHRPAINMCGHSYKPQEYQLSNEMCLNDVLKILKSYVYTCRN